MNIGIVIGRIAGPDGVALETEKWVEVLTRLGHDVFIITGKVEKAINLNISILPELDFHHPDNIKNQDDAFHVQDTTENEIINHTLKISKDITKKLLQWLQKNKINVLISQNANALPCHIPMGLAIHNTYKNTHIPLITHDHDFAWERIGRYNTKSPFIKGIMTQCFPPKDKDIIHCVINSAAKDTLQDMGITSTVIPNVMDFEAPYHKPKNEQLLQELCINAKDIALFQITRIVRRKGIHTAIELIKRLDNPNIKLFIAGNAADDENHTYYKELLALSKHLNVFFVPHIVKEYPLHEIYSVADACTYFSTYEGFGNAFVECILSKTPIFVNNYLPVYWRDIGSKGFKTVQLENGELLDQHIKQIHDILHNPTHAKDIAEHNYLLGKKHFSYDILSQKLKEILTSFI